MSVKSFLLAALVPCVSALSPEYDYYDEGQSNETLPGFISSIWPNGDVPYELDESFAFHEVRRIEFVIDDINTFAECVNIRPKNDNDTNFVSFVRTEGYCLSSYIGYTGGGAQDVALSAECSTPRYIYFVLLQLLGLPAEHMRPDRDEYIDVYWENIQQDYERAFRKYEFIDEKLMLTEYDFESRLHYDIERFTMKRGQKTLSAKENPDRPLGNPMRPTTLDFKKLAALYCRHEGRTVVPTFGSRSEKIAPARLLNNELKFENISDICNCLDAPNENGSCEGRGGFPFKRMWRNCRSENSAKRKLCECENALKNPCTCEAAPEETCPDGNQCPLTRCIKKCRHSDSDPSGYKTRHGKLEGSNSKLLEQQ